MSANGTWAVSGTRPTPCGRGGELDLTSERDLVCPLCRVGLSPARDRFDCRACGRTFPVVAGIPDLRLAGDRYLSLEDDRAKAMDLVGVRGTAADVIRAYWERTPEVPAGLAARYTGTMAAEVQRGAARLDELGATEGNVLDVGCGTGGLLVAAARRGLDPVGIDIALRWLVVARRRLQDEGAEALLVAADGALPPFRRRTFDAVVSVEVLEHASDQRGFINACVHADRPNGRVLIVTSNRFSVAPEPVVGLWGVGFIPRRLAARYVRRRRRTRYDFMRPVSSSELRAMLGPHPGVEVGAAAPPAPSVDAGRGQRRARRAHEIVRRTRPGRRLLGVVGPYLQVRRG